MRTICVFTSTRADFGLLEPVMRRIQDDPGLVLQTLVTGSHLSEKHGSTVREIEAAGLPVSAAVRLDLSDDSPAAIAEAGAACLSGCARELERLAPDLLVVLGDRYEALAAAMAASIMRIPVAHLHGGEITRGVMDDAFRHANTKLAHLHFTATEGYRARVIQMGEPPETVFNVGALGVEGIRELEFLEEAALRADLGLASGRPFLLVTFHPATLEPGTAQGQMNALLDALDSFPEHQVVLTKSGADTESLGVNELADGYAAQNPDRVRAFTSLGRKRYLSAMRLCHAVVGNSSSGIIEAPSLGVPTVNIGSRQEGRARADSVIDCAPTAEAIEAALRRALSPDCRRGIGVIRNPYETPGTAKAVVDRIKAFPGGIQKTFHDLPGRTA